MGTQLLIVEAKSQGSRCVVRASIEQAENRPPETVRNRAPLIARPVLHDELSGNRRARKAQRLPRKTERSQERVLPVTSKLEEHFAGVSSGPAQQYWQQVCFQLVCVHSATHLPRVV